ncbi:MAG TPA: hypothetical protein VH092_28720 [Urbifossiella sp.]|jgi:hypothetical protein|nr:hypothetical protein [Urbifossiella sp.]
MFGDAHRPTAGPPPAPVAPPPAVTDDTAPIFPGPARSLPHLRRRAARAGGAALLGAVCVLATATPAATRAQPAKTPAPAKGKAPPPEDLYGDQGGEKVGPANARIPNTWMRARLEDTFFKLSNPRIGETAGKRKAMQVDYEVLSRGKFDGGFLVLRTDDGSKAEIALASVAGRDTGTIDLVGVQYFGNIKIAKNVAFPENVEMFVVRGDDRYLPPSRFLVSNAVVMGKVKGTTKARDWTAEEIGRYTKPPPPYRDPNAYPKVGEDVPPLPVGGNQSRYVDPDGRLYGLDYRMGGGTTRRRSPA